jgi:hypothetical protein
MQGNAGGILLHLSNALKLTASLEKTPQTQLFVNVLTLIDMVAMTWLNLDQSYSNMSLQIPKVYANKLPVTRHCDLETLTYDLVNIKNEVMTWRHTLACACTKAKGNGIASNHSSFAASRQTIQSRLDAWYREFLSVLPNTEDITTHRRSLLRANYLVTELIVADVYNQHFSAQTNTNTDPGLSRSEYCYEIVEITESVLEAGYSSSRYDAGAGEEMLENTGLLPLFSFRNSFIQPLFYVAQKAPWTRLRQKAIRLLLEKPWREGAWDSFVLGSIAQRSLDASIIACP